MPAGESRRGRRGSFLFGEYFGIELQLHWTFLVLIGWMGLSVLSATGSLLAATGILSTMAAIFGCVALHEYGHALTARRFGIGTRRITLLPIGGIAELERIPEQGLQELWIALAGPAVNFTLAAGVAGVHLFLGVNPTQLLAESLAGGSLAATLIQVNLIMGIFNLVPALPMDGGRILRAALSLRMPALDATRIACRIARVLAAGMAGYALMGGNWLLVLIAFFVWTTAGAELRLAMVKAYQARHGVETPMGFDSVGGNPPGQWIQPEVRKPRRGND